MPIGQGLDLDEHGREAFPTLTLPAYVPPTWSRTPYAFGGSIPYPPPQSFAPEHYAEIDASSTVETVRELADRQSFHCGSLKLREISCALQGLAEPFALAHSQPEQLSQILVDTRPALKAPYTLVKINQSIYLRGWIEAKLSETQMQGHYINVYRDSQEPALGYHPTQFTVRLDECSIQSDSPSYVSLNNIHLDRHAWEKW